MSMELTTLFTVLTCSIFGVCGILSIVDLVVQHIDKRFRRLLKFYAPAAYKDYVEFMDKEEC